MTVLFKLLSSDFHMCNRGPSPRGNKVNVHESIDLATPIGALLTVKEQKHSPSAVLRAPVLNGKRTEPIPMAPQRRIALEIGRSFPALWLVCVHLRDSSPGPVART